MNKEKIWTMIDTKDIINFEEFRSELIHYKGSVSWIDKYSIKHYMYGKDAMIG